MERTRGFAVLVVFAVGVLVAAWTVSAFLLADRRWPAGSIAMEMQLGSAGGLPDGSADWDECAIAALAQWNANLGGSGRNFDAVRGATTVPSQGDLVNSVFWSDDIFGTPFGARVIAVTASSARLENGVDAAVEADVVFNTALLFNCYRGPAMIGATPASSPLDLQRVSLHEFGHVLGLGHPDQSGPPQRVHAIMNSTVSDVDALQTDDVQGALTLYGVPVVGIPFPPRQEVLGFFLALEDAYRDALGRARDNQGFVDAEGSAVWLPEWLRYVLNSCVVDEAAGRVLSRDGRIEPGAAVVIGRHHLAPGVDQRQKRISQRPSRSGGPIPSWPPRSAGAPVRTRSG